MKKTYILQMPDKAGVFLKANNSILKNGGTLIRANFNKVVDLHTLFLEVSASKENLVIIEDELKDLGYLIDIEDDSKFILIQLIYSDILSNVSPVLKILNKYNINISYVNFLDNDSDSQVFNLGFIIEDSNDIKHLLDELSQICEVKILDYDVTDKSLDNTLFYISFADEMRNLLSLTQEETNNFIINSNKIMQILDQKDEKPFKTFEYIRKFVMFIINHHGDNFIPEIYKKKVTDDVDLYLIEPPCGSNVYIFDSGDNLLFIDSGFACFEDEMVSIFNDLVPDFKDKNKDIILTHTDMDHAGLVNLFDNVYVSESSYENFKLENEGKDNYRFQHPIHKPYFKIDKIITNYTPPKMDKVHMIGKRNDNLIFSKIGELNFEDLCFEIFEGIAGHAEGEIIIVLEKLKIVFTGDIFVNIKGFSKDQEEFNLIAPYLMTSVNVDSEKAIISRKEVLNKFKDYLICPGHGLWVVNK